MGNLLKVGKATDNTQISLTATQALSKPNLNEVEFKWASRTAQPSMGNGAEPRAPAPDRRWKGRCSSPRLSGDSPGAAAGLAYLCFIEFPRSRRGICGDQRGTDSVSAGRGETVVTQVRAGVQALGEGSKGCLRTNQKKGWADRDVPLGSQSERTLALSLGLQGTGVSPAPITPHSTQLGPGREVGGDALVHTPDSIAKLSEPHHNVQTRKGKRSRNGNIIY